MDREYIRQVESPITPPKKSACVLGGKLAAGQRFVRGKRGRVEGRVERVDRKSWGREEREDSVRGEKVGKDSNSDCKGLSQRSASGIFLLTFLCVWTFVHLLPTFSLSSSPSPSILFIPLLLFLVEASPFPSSLPSLFFLFTSRASSSCSFFHDRKRDYESEYWQKHGMKYSVTIYISREKKRERGDISGYNLSWKGVGGEVGRSGSRRS